jgi:hypothetical protein
MARLGCARWVANGVARRQDDECKTRIAYGSPPLTSWSWTPVAAPGIRTAGDRLIRCATAGVSKVDPVRVRSYAHVPTRAARDGRNLCTQRRSNDRPRALKQAMGTDCGAPKKCEHRRGQLAPAASRLHNRCWAWTLSAVGSRLQTAGVCGPQLHFARKPQISGRRAYRERFR